MEKVRKSFYTSPKNPFKSVNKQGGYESFYANFDSCQLARKTFITAIFNDRF